MSRRAAVLMVFISIVAAVAVGSLAVPVAGGHESAQEDIVESCAEHPPEDFADPAGGNETIGWFAGFWWDEPLEINTSDGLNESELRDLSARTAARLEALRCLPFEELPPVEIMSRDEFANETAGQYAEIDERTRQFDNAQFETMLLIGSDEDSLDVRQQQRSGGVLGYYNFVEKRIVVVSDDPDSLLIDEGVLVHELGHALQDQHFDLGRYERNTLDLDKAALGVIEGDAHRVEQIYLGHCEAERWSEPCVSQEAGGGGGGGSVPNWGLYFIQFQPYSDGPTFIQSRYNQGGWEAVNELYEDMPRSAMHVIYPSRYGSVELVNVEVEDQSSANWERLTFENDPDYNEIGQVGLSSILIDPAYDGNPIVSQNEFLNFEDGQINETDPLNYDLEETDGWRGDKLYVYTDEMNRTGTVWKIAWTNESEQAAFLEAFERVADHRNGERVEGYAHTWTFGADSSFDMAMTIVPDGDRLWIVTAPSVEELTDIHAGIELVETSDGDDDTPPRDDTDGDDTTPPEDDSEPPMDDTDDDAPTEEDPIPGFGGMVALLGVLLATFLLRQRRDR